MSNYDQNSSAGNQGHVGMGEKIKDAVTPGHHSTQGYTGVPGNNPELGQQRGQEGYSNTGNQGYSGAGTGNQGYSGQQGTGGNTGMGGIGGGQHDHGLSSGNTGGGLTTGNQGGGIGNTGMGGGLGNTGAGGGIGSTGAGGPQEHYEKKTHNTSDHNESESFESSTK